MIRYYHKQTGQYLEYKTNLLLLTLIIVILNIASVTINYNTIILIMYNIIVK